MRKSLKWAFISPFLMFGLWIIGLFSPDFRESFINLTKKILRAMEKELERNL